MYAYFYLSDITNLINEIENHTTAFKVIPLRKHMMFITNVKTVGTLKYIDWAR